MSNARESKNSLDEVRSLQAWGMPEHRYESIEAFCSFSSLSSGIHSIYTAGLPIDMYVDVRPGCPIVFFFNGAKPRSDSLKLPVFAGLRVLPAGGVSRIYLNDPSLYLDKDLSLGWYAGSRHLPLQEGLTRIIRHTIALTHPSNVIFTGGSGGGFASLYYSQLFAGSLAVVWNPQTNLLESYPEHVSSYSKAAFGIGDLESAKALLPHLIQTDLCQRYASGKTNNYVLYLQNHSDTFHVKFHLKPFLSDINDTSDGEFEISSGKLRDNLYVHGGDWGDGHVTPPPVFLTTLYQNILKVAFGWDKFFANAENLKNLISMSDHADTVASATKG